MDALEFFGAPETDKLVLVEHDPGWSSQFVAHAERIRSVLGDIARGLHHVGSTAVPGLAAKPVIDMLLLVDDITADEDYVEPLVAAGYVLRVREPGHRLLRTPERDVHLHVHEPGDPEVDRLLLFRDRLLDDAEDRSLYEATKRELITQEWTHMQEYADAKDDVIALIRSRARD